MARTDSTHEWENDGAPVNDKTMEDFSMGTKEAAQQGLSLLKKAILTELHHAPDGLRNSELAENLGLRSAIRGKQKDYLSFSLLGLLLEEGAVKQRNDKKWEPTT